MEYIRLIGIVIIVIGFMLKLDTIAVVLVAGLATAFVSGISFTDFLSLLGEAFVSNRLVTLFLLTLPMIGITEHFGLRQQAVKIIEGIRGMTTGRLFTLYMFARELAGFFSIRMQGHTQFIRPLIEPMAQAAAKTDFEQVDEKDIERIKTPCALPLAGLPAFIRFCFAETNKNGKG